MICSIHQRLNKSAVVCNDRIQLLDGAVYPCDAVAIQLDRDRFTNVSEKYSSGACALPAQSLWL